MDAEIKMIFKRHHRSITSYTPTDMSPRDIKDDTDINIHYYALICTSDHESGVYIDISTIFQEQLIGQSDDWSTFYSGLTPVIVDSYTISGAGLTNDGSVEFHQATVVHPLSTVGLDIAYCDKRDPTEINKHYKRFDLPDLAISKKAAYTTELKDLSLENCIASVNGFICNATYFENTLYISEGAKNLWSISKHTSANIILIDVSPLGTLTRLPLTDCTIEYMDGIGSTIYENSIRILLPDTYSFKEYTPLLSIAGKLYLPNELTIPTNNSIILKPHLLNLPTTLLAMQETQATYIPDTDMLESSNTPIEYLYQLGKTDRSRIYDVLYLINKSNIFVQRDIVTTDLYWLTKFNTNRSGLLMRLSDRSLMDYTTIEYDECYNLRYGPVYPNDLMRITVENDGGRQIGIKDIRCAHVNDHFKWLRSSPYEMIYLTC